MRVCINKNTDKLIESQSGGSTQDHLDTLTDNAIRAGYNIDDIESKFVTDSEFQALIESEIPELTQDEKRELEYPRTREMAVALMLNARGNTTRLDALLVIMDAIDRKYPYYAQGNRTKMDTDQRLQLNTTFIN